jgi:hypothetical protein
MVVELQLDSTTGETGQTATVENRGFEETVGRGVEGN